MYVKGKKIDISCALSACRHLHQTSDKCRQLNTSAAASHLPLGSKRQGDSSKAQPFVLRNSVPINCHSPSSPDRRVKSMVRRASVLEQFCGNNTLRKRSARIQLSYCKSCLDSAHIRDYNPPHDVVRGNKIMHEVKANANGDVIRMIGPTVY